jgi:glycosyltransferase involved in cell wall biosynthesis
MACRTAIIGSDCGAIPEVVGQAGLIFPEGDVDCLTTHLRMVYENPERGLRYGHEGYVQVMSKYSQDVIAARIVQVYQQVIDGNNA